MMKEEDNTARILMRREKTMKVCANHLIKSWMVMKPNCGSKKAWVWKTRADYADEEPKQEVKGKEGLIYCFSKIQFCPDSGSKVRD